MHSAAVGCIFDGNIAGLLSCAVVEADWTRRTVWTQTVLTERCRNVECESALRRLSLTSLLPFSLFYPSATSYTSFCLSMAARTQCTADRVWLNHSPYINSIISLSELQYWQGSSVCLLLAINSLTCQDHNSWIQFHRRFPRKITHHGRQVGPTVVRGSEPREATFTLSCRDVTWPDVTRRFSTPIIDGHDVGNGNIVSS
jgi:hypothetical protein